jgi:TPR repeat protein
MYFNGRGVPQDYTGAVKWYRLAVEQGDANAQTSLGAMYVGGHGVPQDHAVAVGWYRLAADQGYAGAEKRRRTCAQQKASDTSPRSASAR